MVKTTPIHEKDKRGFYGRRQGRPLSAERQRVFDTLYPKLKIEDDVLLESCELDPHTLFAHSPSKFIFEIGFGYGERLAEMKRQYPDYRYIGAEPFINGMAAFLADIEKDENDNIRLWMEDAMQVARSLKDNSIDELYILNPDPWHKAKHHKRRIVNTVTLDEFARILKPKAKLIMSSDVPDMIDWMATHAAIHPAFEWTAASKLDWLKPPKDWIHTRYETKNAKGAQKMCYLIFERKA